MLDRRFATPIVKVGGGDSYINAVAVTPSDTQALAESAQALLVLGGGSVAVVTVGGQTAPFANVPAGAVLRVACTQVLASGTTATNIYALS